MSEASPSYLRWMFGIINTGRDSYDVLELNVVAGSGRMGRFAVNESGLLGTQLQ